MGGTSTPPVTSPGELDGVCLWVGLWMVLMQGGMRRKHVCASAMIWKIGSGQAR